MEDDGMERAKNKAENICAVVMIVSFVVLVACGFAADAEFQSTKVFTVNTGAFLTISNGTGTAFTVLAVEANYDAEASGSINFYRLRFGDTTKRRITGFDFNSATNVFLDRRDLEGVWLPDGHSLVVENNTSETAVISVNRGRKK